jgi:hypothetical protein
MARRRTQDFQQWFRSGSHMASGACHNSTMIETVTITGRARKPLGRKLNLFWWFLNDFEPTPPDWHRPGKPLRTLFSYLRNPFQNAGRYMLSVADRTYTVTGQWPVMATVWEDVRCPTFRTSCRDMGGSARRSSSRMTAPRRGSHTRHRAGWLIRDGNRTGSRALSSTEWPICSHPSCRWHSSSWF